jgi:hypothetical protein
MYHPPDFETSSARRQSIIRRKWLFISRKTGKSPKIGGSVGGS